MQVDNNKKQYNNISYDLSLECIAKIHTDFPEKFGLPRQSGIVEELKAKIIFESKYRNPDALRGLEGFSYIWLIWGFHHINRNVWAPMVKPPRLGGNMRMGVFATRSPNRPNTLGLSSVKLDRIENHSEYGPIIHVSGIDLVDQTPIYDIKPYLVYTDSHPGALGGYLDKIEDNKLRVDFSEELLEQIPKKYHEALMGILSQDPRPSYHDDPERIYGFYFAGYNIRFRVRDNILSVYDITKL
ncbi:MAG: tRNA (N6-threonylcarbamoyladenosine(37)-N6)-methyltransferase TrmO [Clostridiales bacterium]|jgi:tRNA-Thr(GGU) m(6)t(6)A37 methyltransferase TsaA|nr:tRNA (N6-threonylcarbamoyladenosine(37)-N6)-methyltransferase TrmO [Clostridiales bacterium]